MICRFRKPELAYCHVYSIIFGMEAPIGFLRSHVIRFAALGIQSEVDASIQARSLDALDDVARSYGVSAVAIAAFNPLDNKECRPMTLPTIVLPSARNKRYAFADLVWDLHRSAVCYLRLAFVGRN